MLSLLKELEMNEQARGENSGIWERFEQRKLKNGSEYLTAGAGDEIFVVINAFGQNIFFWERLLRLIIQEPVKLIIWKARGMDIIRGAVNEYVGFEHHVADVLDILDEEQPRKCHMLSWCTGAKISLRCCSEMPDRITSLSILSGSFSGYSGLSDFETKYERNMKALCRMLRHNPAGAAVMTQAMKTMFGHSGTTRLPPSDLQIRQWVLETFETDTSTVNYAHLLAEFWEIDDENKLFLINRPVLVVAGEHDKLTSPAASYELAQKIVGSTFVELKEANHYLLYDNCEAVFRAIMDLRKTS